MNKTRSNATYMKDYIDLEITEIITFIKESALNSLVTLNTLNVLKILTDLNALMAEFFPLIKIISTKDKMTTSPSNIFIVSFK